MCQQGAKRNPRAAYRIGQSRPLRPPSPTDVSLPFFSSNRFLIFVFSGSLRFTKYSRELFGVGVTSSQLPWWAASSVSTARLSKCTLLSALIFFFAFALVSMYAALFWFSPSGCDWCWAQPFCSFCLSFQGSPLLCSLCGCTSLGSKFVGMKM